MTTINPPQTTIQLNQPTIKMQAQLNQPTQQETTVTKTT